MQRRLLLLLILTISFLLLAGSFLFHHPSYTPLPVQKFTGLTQHHAPSESPSSNLHFTNTPEAAPLNSNPSSDAISITITETGGSHDEVVAALVHSFGSHPRSSLSLYQLLPRYKITEIIAAFSLPRPAPAPKQPQAFIDAFAANQPEAKPQIFVAATCELDVVRLAGQLGSLLADGKTWLFCVVHHSDRWASDAGHGLEGAITSWVEAGRITFITLSPHTAEYLSKSIGTWATPSKTSVDIRSLAPLFPVELPAMPGPEEKEELAFGLQGDYDPARRDYGRIFQQLKDFIAGGGNVIMHLLGHGAHPQVPPEITKNVVFDERLAYGEFYGIISKGFALLPAFASKEYLDRKASSSVPAALIGGVPLVATKEIVKAYSYIDESVVWMQNEGEGDLELVGRILKMNPSERRKKKELVRAKCATIIEVNKKMVEQWIEEALGKLKLYPTV
ncbi:hypothetical protein FPQ18DRAFT_312154 [Pyronema domesticum]|nr:hypothetical protein FPQ18DRAFT_312154 [Pyronema domesticum]